MRIATWNLARPRPNGWKLTPRIEQKLQEVNADIWVLTETHAALKPGPDYASHGSEYDQSLHRVGEHWTMIWSRYPIIQQIPTSMSQLAACCEIHTPLGPSIVYGTVLPDGTAKSWQPHYDKIKAQGKDWKRLRADFPRHLLFVAGDFNQNRGGPHLYGTNEGRDLLTTALHDADLICATERDLATFGILRTLQTIDHICVPAAWRQRVSVGAWEGTCDDGVQLSDHNGIVIDLS
jgi:endonuclease/exonuclease/phosphatase family metal-dependent hydrolase